MAKASLAVLMMLAANLLFAVVDSSTKWLLGAGYMALQLAFIRYAGQLLLTTGLLAKQGTSALKTARPLMPRLLVRAGLLVLSTVMNFLALQTLSLSVTSAIMFSAPIIVCALSWPLLGERVGPVRWAAVAFGFVGVLVVIRPFGETLNAAAFLMLISATGLAFYSIMTRKLAGDVEPLVMQFILGLTGTVVLAPFAVVLWTPPTDALTFAMICALGALAWAGHELLIHAHQRAEANYLMPYAYSYLIYMSLAGYLIFGDLPDRWTILGAVMIALSGLSIWYRELRLTRGAKPVC